MNLFKTVSKRSDAAAGKPPSGQRIAGLCLLALIASLKVPAWAGPDGSAGLWQRVPLELGGHVKARGSVSRPADGSVYRRYGGASLWDGTWEARIMAQAPFGDWGAMEIHYEAVAAGGDTRQLAGTLESALPGLELPAALFGSVMEDDQRVFDLTHRVVERVDHVLYHRLDRLSLTLLPQWGMLRIGRQAVTWGNGLLFNPMDLFNPFSPTDIERDYKVGDDMVTVHASATPLGDLQVLIVPRRDRANRDLEWDAASLAAKAHLFRGAWELDLMAAKHYREAVLGFGASRTLGDAVGRMDVVWHELGSEAGEEGFASLVLNLDTAWVWRGWNFYGFGELYYNGLGERRPERALADPDILQRLQRGEMFTLGRWYAGGHLRWECHPLVNIELTAIFDLQGASGILQPRLTWDLRQNTQLVLGAEIPYGARGTEYGGVPLPGTPLTLQAPGRAFLWVSRFF